MMLCAPWLSAAPSYPYFEMIPVFWEQLYPNGGESLYCGDKIGEGDRRYNIEHVFPMSWVARQLRCGSRNACRKTSPWFNDIETDMHNLYPVRGTINRARATAPFAEIDGNDPYIGNCDFEVDGGRNRVEPRDAVKGDIARTMLYMSDKWNLTLFRGQRELMLRWHEQDPVSQAEFARNQRIRQIQGWGNHWIQGR